MLRVCVCVYVCVCVCESSQCTVHACACWQMLRKGVGAEGTKANVKRMASKQKDTSRTAKLTAKNVNVNYVTQRVAALPPTVKLTARTGVSVQEQLHDILKEHSVRLIDLFREWDDDGAGWRHEPKASRRL